MQSSTLGLTGGRSDRVFCLNTPEKPFASITVLSPDANLGPCCNRGHHRGQLPTKLVVARDADRSGDNKRLDSYR